MRNLVALASLGTLAFTLTACRPEATRSPGSGPTSADPNPSREVPTASAQAKAEFGRAVQAYASARADGKVTDDECDAVAAEFTRVYKAHGAAMAIAEFNAGVVREECGQPDRAEAIYAGLVAAVPKFDLAYNNLGVLYWKKGQEEKALDLFKRGVEANKLSARAARNNVAGLLRDKYVDKGDVKLFDEAQTTIQGVLALDSSNKAAYENLARIYYDRGHRKDKSYLVLANLVVTQGMRVLANEDKKSADLHNIQGLLLLERDDQVSALKTFKSAVEIEPNHTEANLNIGFISIRFRDYATAETAFKTALKSPTEQKNLELWLALGVAQRGLKKYKDAETSYNQAVKLNAGDPRAFFNLGVLYQDHIAVQVDDLDEVSKLGAVARKYYVKFGEAAGKADAYKVRVLESQDRIATLEQNDILLAQTKALEKEVARLKVEAEKAEAIERERLAKLEKEAMAAEGAAPAP